jgi:hypothetical protein
MKKLILSLFLVFVAAAFSSVFAQAAPPGAGTPAGAGDKNLGADSIKMRSVEMERVKQDAQRAEAASFAPINKDISSKFPQIKEDFEGIQILEAAIITAYTTGKTIDYKLIETSADGMNKKAARLDSNLFPEAADKKADKPVVDRSNEKVQKPKSVRDLIVELDTTIGNFVSSKIFANIKVIEPELAIKTRTELLSILRLSERLSTEAKKLQ